MNEVECERPDWRAASARNPPPSTTGGTYRIAPYPAGDPDRGLRYARPRSLPSTLSPDHGAVQGTRNSSEHGTSHKEKTLPVNNASSVSKTSSSSVGSTQLDTSIPFMRDMIPSEQEYPELHRSLMQKWYERQEAVRGMGDALDDDDADRYSNLRRVSDFINIAMHREWAAAYKGHEVRAEFLPEIPESRLLEVDELPLDQPDQRQSFTGDSEGEEVESAEERYLESDEWMETQKEMFWNTVRPRKCSFKEINTGVFTLHLSFQGVETPRVVNDNMLLRSLFIMAISYLRSEFKFVVKDDDEIELEYRDRLLPRDGAIGGVPILQNAVIVIIYPRYSYVSSREEGTVP